MGRGLGFGFTNTVEHVERGRCICDWVAAVSVVSVGRVWMIGSGRVRWGVLMSVWVWGLNIVCIWYVQVILYCVRRIAAYLRCNQLHFIDICIIPYIWLGKISQIQTCLRVVVGPGLVSRRPAFVRSSVRHPAGSHGQLAK